MHAHPTVAPQTEETAPKPKRRRRRFEAKGLALALCGIVLGIVLASHVPPDAANPGPAQNALGDYRARIATALYDRLGAAAWAIAIVLVGWGWRVESRNPVATAGKMFVGVMLAVGAGALALAVLWPVPDWPLRNGLGGGIAGDILYAEMVPLVASMTGLDARTIGWLAATIALASVYLALGGKFRVDPSFIETLDSLRRFRLPRVALARRQRLPAEPVPALAGHVLQDPATEPAPRRRRKGGKSVFQDVVESDPTMRYELPPLDLLAVAEPAEQAAAPDQAAMDAGARRLESVLADFGVKGEVVAVKPGPVVTLYEFEPAPGTKTTRVTGLAEDIARSMSATSTRAAAIPGRKVIGIEIPNETREMVRLRELMEDEAFADGDRGLALALGKNIAGVPVAVDLAAMPHVLIAGTTGSGKSVGINTMILSLLFRMTPNDCRFILIDPKMLELTCYAGIPHLLSPVVTDPVEAAAALNWVVREMESRYKVMSEFGARSIGAYNECVLDMAEAAAAAAEADDAEDEDEAADQAEAEAVYTPSPMPLIVVIIDEVADLMLAAGKEVETAVQRIAQKARAAGIHLVMATQRPSADVITGTIKANFPTRISFRVSSKIDSRTILGDSGAEQLLGHGDMLYQEGAGKMIRVHGAFVADEEVEAVANFLREQGEPDYVDAVTGGLGLHRE